MKTKFDAIIANVYDLKKVLDILRQQLGLKPFFQNTINLQNGHTVQMALVSLSNGDFEFIECARFARPEQISHYSDICIESPAVSSETVLQLEENLLLRIMPGEKPAFRSVTAHSSTPDGDADVLLKFCDNCIVEPLEQDGKTFNLNHFKIHFVPLLSTQASLEQPTDPASVHGWRRISFAINPLEDAVALLEKAGAVTVVPIFQVMPGLREAMISLPSGLIIQPMEQKLFKMIPHFLWQKIKPKKKVAHG